MWHSVIPLRCESIHAFIGFGVLPFNLSPIFEIKFLLTPPHIRVFLLVSIVFLQVDPEILHEVLFRVFVLENDLAVVGKANHG